MKLTFEDYEQLQNVVQLLEDLQYVDMRLKLLPDINAYNSLCNRLRCIKIYLKLDEEDEEENEGEECERKVKVRDVINPKCKWDVVSGEERERVEKYINILNERQKMKTNVNMAFT